MGFIMNVELSENGTTLLKRVILVLSIAMCAFHVYTSATMPLLVMEQRSVHLGFALSLVFLYAALDQKNRLARLLSYLFAIIGIVTNVFMYLDWENVTTRSTRLLPIDYIMGILLILVVLEATRRSLGAAMPIIAIVFLVYSFVGPYLGGILRFTAIPVRRLLSTVYFGSEGIYGSTLGASATFAFMFVLYGEFLLHFGAGDFFVEISQALFGKVRGGSGKIAVICSGLFGMVSGSAVANVAGTGVITIPLMKHDGFDSEYSGGVVASASAGGQLMPPVMGAAAFIMAEMLQISYGAICLAALVPAVLYYLSLFIMVDLRAAKNGFQVRAREDLPKVSDTMRKGWHYLISVVVLLVLLLFLRWSAAKAAFWATIALVVADGAKTLIFKNKIEYKRFVDCFVSAAKTALTIATATSCAGIIIGVFIATGLNLRFSSMLVAMAGGNLFVLLIYAMLGSIVLGMGLPTTPVYIIMAALVAPALITLGVPNLAAHLFVFYYGVMSAITPPVGVAFYVASGIAEAKQMKTGFMAWRTALPGFILPFVFAYNQGILLQGSPLECIVQIFFCFVGIVALAIGLEGYLKRKMNLIERGLLIIAALLSIVPEAVTSYIGTAVIIAVLAVHWLTVGKTSKLAES